MKKSRFLSYQKLTFQSENSYYSVGELINTS